MRIAAIVLAAGEGRRIGRPKALLVLEGESFLARCCRQLGEAGLAPVVAVLGAEAEAARAAAPSGTVVVVNERWREGMLTSVWRGLDTAEALGAEAVLLHPVDNPAVEPETIAAVVAALRAGAVIAVPACGGRRGHPAGFARPSFAALRAVSPLAGARAVLLEHPAWVRHVPAGPDCLIDVDSPDAYARLSAAAGRPRSA